MGDRAKRQKVSADCLATANCTKSALVNILRTLHRNGELSSGLGSGTHDSVRRNLRLAQEQHAFATTPYGRVVQSIDLPFKNFRRWDYCHPWAFLYYLSSICVPFAEMMAVLVARVPTLAIILYIDEVIPGNAMRHDKGRTLQAIYWAVKDWPQWVLSRHEAWPIFAVVQAEICANINGGILGLLPYVLKTFWPRGRDTTIVTIVHNATSVAVSFKFAGWIADLDAHAKAISSTKTVSGTKPCIECENITKFIDVASRPLGILKTLSCCQPSEFVRNTDQSVFDKADELKAAAERGDKIDALSIELGINYNPASLLFDPSVRHIYKPVTHTLRDWMHMLVSDGVAGTELCLCIKECQQHVPLDILHTYAQQFRQPRTRGAIPKEWFTTKSLGDHNMKHFASEVLGMVPIVNCFLHDVVQPLGVMQLHIQCFELLDEIMCLLSLGADNAVRHVSRIRLLIYQHGVLYKAIYGEDQCRPKFHHLYHVPDGIDRIKKNISCFVLERKHRATKDASRECKRHIEHTVVIDMVNRHCCNAQNSASAGHGNVYQKEYLLDPRATHVPKVTTAVAAILEIGTVHTSDVLFLADGSVAKVERLWDDTSTVVLQVTPYIRVSAVLWKMDAAIGNIFVDAIDVVAMLTYAIESDNVIRIIVPVLYR